MISEVVPESQILKPRDPSLVDDNDWPEFQLTNASITDSESGELVSLLRASEGSPINLIGKLAKFSDKAQAKRFLHSKLASKLPFNVQVSDIQHYCYGQNDEGEAIMWAAGKAGWFLIQPSRTYRAIHKDSCEAVNCLYFLADFYRELKGKKFKTTPVGSIFQEYAAEPSHQCPDEDHAEALFRKYKEFLFEWMVQGKEGVNWKNTMVYEWLSKATAEENSSDETDSTTELQTPHAADSSESEPPSTRRAGKGKSSLRPRSNKHSLKSMGRRRSTDDINFDDTPTHVNTAPLKRKSKAGRVFKPRKRGDTSDAAQDEADERSSSPAEESSDGPPAEATVPLPLRTAPKKSSALNHEPIQIIEEELPSFEPQGPGDSWHCAFDGCSHVVYDAKKPANRELIKEHYKQHAVEKQKQLDLVFTEERPYLPVNNLIKRIREMAAKGQHKPNSEETLGSDENSHAGPIAKKY